MKRYLSKTAALALAIFALGLLGGCLEESITGIANQGTVVFKVEPEDAEIWVDGHKEGIAEDFDDKGDALYLRDGRHTVEIKKEGYQSHTQELFIGANSRQTIQVRLHKL